MTKQQIAHLSSESDLMKLKIYQLKNSTSNSKLKNLLIQVKNGGNTLISATHYAFLAGTLCVVSLVSSCKIQQFLLFLPGTWKSSADTCSAEE